MKHFKLNWRPAILLVLLVIILGFLHFVMGVCVVSGSSMYPSLKHKDLLIVRWGVEIKEGDIVIVKNNKTNLVKRVIGLPQDTIEFWGSEVYRNGIVLQEDYINKEEVPIYRTIIEKLGENEYYVVGDNRNHSTDSRVFGKVARENIKGVVICNLSDYGITYNVIVWLIGVSFCFLLLSYGYDYYYLEKKANRKNVNVNDKIQ